MLNLMAFTSGTNMYYYSYLSNQWTYNIVDEQLKRHGGYVIIYSLGFSNYTLKLW